MTNQFPLALTCALPMYKAKDIGWLALESLCAQERVTFDWELVVIEETDGALGWEKIKKYEPRLQKVGCAEIKYTALDTWLPLGEKWRKIAAQAEGVGYLLVAADCYSQPLRLAETYELLNDPGVDWVQSATGAFYNIGNDTLSIYDQELANGHPCCLNMATLTAHVRRLPSTDRRRSVDGWMYTEIERALGRGLCVAYNESDSWRRGVDTHGLNNLSAGRGAKLDLEPRPPFRGPLPREPLHLEDIVPESVSRRLTQLRPLASERTFVKKGISG
jgi:hypothetical protein